MFVPKCEGVPAAKSQARVDDPSPPNDNRNWMLGKCLDSFQFEMKYDLALSFSTMMMCQVTLDKISHLSSFGLCHLRRAAQFCHFFSVRAQSIMGSFMQEAKKVITLQK